MTVVVPASVMPVPVAVMPAHLLRLQAVDLVTRGDGRMRIAARRRACILVQEKRRERRRLGGHCERGGAGGDTEPLPGFHAVGIGQQAAGGYALDLDITAHLPGMDDADAQKLVEATHQLCPYSNATRGNVDVKLTVV